jgi:Asp-tRNA(Asn)/Glu-tRNA(Gln) amidotransferase A subunit family amidase
MQVLLAYGKRAIWAHQRTNCLTEITIPSAEEWLHHSLASSYSPELGGVNLCDPLAGMPVSRKDMVGLAGYESYIGHSRLVGDKIPADTAITRLLKDASGAVREDKCSHHAA